MRERNNWIWYNLFSAIGWIAKPSLNGHSRAHLTQGKKPQSRGWFLQSFANTSSKHERAYFYCLHLIESSMWLITVLFCFLLSVCVRCDSNRRKTKEKKTHICVYHKYVHFSIGIRNGFYNRHRFYGIHVLGWGARTSRTYTYDTYWPKICVHAATNDIIAPTNWAWIIFDTEFSSPKSSISAWNIYHFHAWHLRKKTRAKTCWWEI